MAEMMNDPMTLPAHPEGSADILFVAGEHSGDQHAALLAEGLAESQPGIRMSALGGPALEAAGVQLLHDLTRDSVVGLVEVIKHYGEFKRLFNALLEWVEANQPKVVVLVDYPGFNLRFAEALKKRALSRRGGGTVAVYQYVSPQIWAWKAGRRFKMAETLDELGAIFPFEVECYGDTELPVHFVGHPFVRHGYTNPLAYNADGPILLLPGSRKQAVRRIFPLLVKSYQAYRSSGGDRPCVCLFPEPEIGRVLKNELERLEVPPEWIHLKEAREGGAACAVLTSSGTMSLNCALAGIPGAVVYKAHPLTVWMGRWLVKVDWLGMANLVLDREVYPEFLQAAAQPRTLGQLLTEAIDNPDKRSEFEAAAGELAGVLTGTPSESPVQRIQHLLTGANQ